MSQVKMPYYPKIEASCVETTFGAVEISCPNLYDKPIEGMRILRVDLLECLREDFGDNCMLYRDLVYKLVSGSCKDQKEHIEIFASAYRRFHKFALYVNQIYYYGETNIPIIPRVLSPVRDSIDSYRKEVTEELTLEGGKYLTHTNDYLYYGFKGSGDIPTLKGASVIC